MKSTKSAHCFYFLICYIASLKLMLLNAYNFSFISFTSKTFFFIILYAWLPDNHMFMESCSSHELQYIKFYNVVFLNT